MKNNRRKKVPNFLQPFLWSVKINELDPETDKVYIIHQLLAFGNLRALKWLREQYSTPEVKKIFLTRPMRIYRDSAFHFARDIFLDLPTSPNPKKYVSTQLPTTKQHPKRNV